MGMARDAIGARETGQGTTMLKALLAAGLTAGLIGQATAQPAGAPVAAPMQDGGWGAQGWQAGNGPAAMPAQGPIATHRADMVRDMPPPGAGPRRGPPANWHGDYRRTERGGRLGGPWLEPTYVVQDWQGWGLARPAPGTRWVRYYDDAVLIDPAGTVIDTRYGVDWDTPRGAGQGWARGGPGFHDIHGYGVPRGPANVAGTTSYRSGPNTVVTVQTVPTPAPAIYGGGYDGYDGYGGGGVTVVTTPGTITTTTTTSYERVSGWRPSHRHRARKRCYCRK